ncbi:MAG: ABC transporter ATP-binding protein [Phycisphaerae bacterium]|nr:ABC transporter ATP-binding protein [Phycisphaerae bacterium]
MTDDDNILVAQGLKKSYGSGPARVDVLRGLDLTVRAGEFLAVMGPSGCGKSTLLHVLGLVTPPDGGAMRLCGRAVPRGGRTLQQMRRQNVGMVFQRFNLLSVLTAEQNVNISLRVRGLARDGARVRALFEEMGVDHVRRRKPGAMSIGEQQRVAVVRALAHRPDVLLADEPTGNLDSASAQRLLELFRRLHGDHQRTIVMITHSAEAASVAQRIVHMKDGTLCDS